MQWFSTSPEKTWEEKEIICQSASEDSLELTNEKFQCVGGFGGCFNELGWIALMKLDDSKRQSIISELFHTETGCKFSICRMPIGANDYSSKWYSCNENENDFQMEKFSIERDRLYLIPYIKEALRLKPDLKLFASPWSPPTWMKFPSVHNNGRLVMEKKNLEAYALYFKKLINAYRDEGIDIHQIHIQNEPFANQKFPSCLWSGDQYAVFIRDYLGPLFANENIPTEIWFGTLNGPDMKDYDSYVDRVLFDSDVRKYIKGVGYQWAGKHVIQRTHESFPELRLMQTENECGDGLNTWDYATYVFNLIRHYFNNGANSYVYWNMVLEPKGTSTWGWDQNSMITVRPDSEEVIYNPEFYVMKHFSHFVQPGAVRLGIKGHWSGASLAFENPDGRLAVIVSNALDRERRFTFKGREAEFSVDLKTHSFNTFII
jgi:glucosylceramidase